MPPAEDEVELLFGCWRESLPRARKYLPAAWDDLTASLWRCVGLRISETDIRAICAMFGLSVTAAERCAATVDHPDLTAEQATHDHPR